jgi:hypothetical protein
VESAFHDARFELEDNETGVQRMIEAMNREGVDSSLKPFVEIVKTSVESFHFAFRSTSNKFRHAQSGDAVPVTLDRRTLVDIHAKLKRSQMRVKSAERRWKNLLLKVKLLQVFFTLPSSCFLSCGMCYVLCVMD